MTPATDDYPAHAFQAKVHVDISWSRFQIKTVENDLERELALRLRHDVFMTELLGRSSDGMLDKDSFDDICDHLVIIEKASNRFVGTYRFISSAFSQAFYTQTEFDLGNLSTTVGTKLEMGRACIHPDFRNGFTFIALWKGLAGYIAQHPVSHLFGCSSVMNTEPAVVAAIIDYLDRHQHYGVDYTCSPLPHYELAGLDEAINAIMAQSPEQRAASDAHIEPLIPPLLWAYIEAGAKVVGRPAHDPDFACMDFLTILDTENLRDDLVRKYKPW